MKTIQVRDDAMVILANEMSDEEFVEFLRKWKVAIENGDSVMWTDVVVLGTLPKYDEVK